MSSFARIVDRVNSVPFYRNAIIFTVGSLVASVTNYFYYPAMSHLLPMEDYAELQVIASFFLQLGSITLALSLVNVNLVRNHDEGEGVSLVAALQKAAFWLSAAVGAVIGVAGGVLKDFFHFRSVMPFMLVIPVVLVQVISTFWVGYLQGHGDFVGVSAYGVSAGVGKIFFSVVLASLGLGAAGGVLGMALGLTAALAATRFAARRPLPDLRQAVRRPGRREFAAIGPHLLYVAEVVVSLAAMSVLLSIDVPLVKHLFPGHSAGQYAGVATVARIPFFASMPLAAVMLPAISLRDRLAGAMAFRQALTLTMAISASGIAVLGLFPAMLVTLLLGDVYTGSSGWLPLLSVDAALVAVTNVMVYYLLALRSHGAVVVSLGALTVAMVLVLFHHATVHQIIVSMAVGLLAGQVAFCVLLAGSVRRRRGGYGAR